MKYLQYTLICLLGLFFAACSHTYEPDLTVKENNATIVGDKIILTTSFEVPGFREVSTRAFSDAPILDDLNLYIIEFVDNGSPLINTLNAVYRPDKKEVVGDVVKYKVTLNRTDQPRILHFVAVTDNNLNIPNGVEGSVMPGLTSQNSNDAYWRRLEFKNGYCTHVVIEDKDEWEFNDDFRKQLLGTKDTGPKNLKLIRNFAKITVGIAENATVADGATGFDLEGFMIVNTPLKGTMVPYSSTTQEFPEFLEEDGVTPISYKILSKTYSGISPANTTLGNQVTSGDGSNIQDQDLTTYVTNEDGITKTWKCLPSEYIYERPFNSLYHTFIIIKGTYHNRVLNPDDNPSYYKLDLGTSDNDGIFRYYGLLRNYNFFIRINRIETSGYATVAEAAEGTVYNNISFDISTDNLMNISDGRDIVRVNFTTAVITENNVTLDFRYAYKAGILESGNGTYNNGMASFIGLGANDVPGAVIKSVSYLGDQYIGNDQNTPWRTLQISCDNPTAVTKTQEFTIVNKATGLGRTITLVSHLKWDFENLCEYAGIWENYPATYNGLYRQNANGSQGTMITGLSNSTYAEKCGANVASQFTVFFDIPNNIPEVLFPLEFTIESDHQGLENEPMGTIVVAPGPSLFSENGQDIRIQYRKSVTWTEYNSQLRMDVRDDNGTTIENSDGTITHRVRCRFRTIETVANNTHIRVRIANENFNSTNNTVEFDRLSTANGLTGPGLIWVDPQDND